MSCIECRRATRQCQQVLPCVSTDMANPPWEPYPENKKKIQERGKRSKNKQSQQGPKYQRANPATDSSLSLSSSTSTDPLPEEIASVTSCSHTHEGEGSLQSSHTRVRPEECCCLSGGGCGDEDGCCVEDLFGTTECPCFQRINITDTFEDKLEVDTCGICLEDGKLRACCNRHYCKLCYQGTGNCPGCQLITVGANRGLLNEDKTSADGGAPKPVVREGEECRICLRQGFARKCCGEFYCSECYFRSGHCPCCQRPAERKIKYQRVPKDPGLVPVMIGYLATLLVCLAVLACVSVVVANDNSFLTTVFGQTCYGFFPSCIPGPKCVAFEGDIANGLEPITEWSACDDKLTVNKVYGSYCVFDEEVFVYSGEKWGFDFCVDEFLSSPGGVYVFEDTFEFWNTENITSNSLASARWDHVTNGVLSEVCGVGAGEGTIMFSGSNHREAETLDMDLRYGGKLVFLMKMGPYVLDSSAAVCKPAYGGNVYLYYSLDSGETWETLTILETFTYRLEEFTQAEVEVPSSSKVRFKWKQENFENALEFWALDDVKALSYFSEDWHKKKSFMETMDTETETLREIRCCLNSEQCDLSKSRQEAVDCSKYVAETSNERALMGGELFVLLAGLVALARLIYRTGEGMVLEGWEYVVPLAWRKKRSKIFMADDPVPGAMNKLFKLEVSSRWRFRFVLLVSVPVAICWLYCAALLQNFFLVEELTLLPAVSPSSFRFKVHISGLFLLATFIDVYAAFLLARDVVCVLPVWVPKVDVDLRPSAGWLQIGRRRIPLKDIKDTEMFTKGFCLWVAAGYITGVFPWSLINLILKYSYIPYKMSRHTTVALGSVLLIRAWLGPELVIKLAYTLRWLLTLDVNRRDEIGNAFTAGKTKHLVIYCSVFGTLLTMGFMILFSTRSFALVSAIAVFLFALYGLGLSIVQGLPLTPNFKLTTIDRGLLIRVHRRVFCPCERHLDQCGDMHSRDELLCVFVRDTLAFTEMLRGDDSIE